VNRWLEGNPVGQVLAAVAGALVVVALALGVTWSLPPRAATEDAGGDDERLLVDVPRLADNEPIESYAIVSERPVFNENRQPDLASDLDPENLGDEPETVVDAPELELAGVVITPTVRMVTLRQKKAGESLVAFEGQPLHGNYGSWHVSRIAPREITLASGEGEELQLQLQVHDEQIAPPPKAEPRSKEVASEDDAADTASDAPLTRAEEIRQRIAERREELRRAAEANPDTQEQAVDYQSAIQSMISGKKQRTDNEEQQR
jgi:hypothetical protein